MAITSRFVVALGLGEKLMNRMSVESKKDRVRLVLSITGLLFLSL
jgi:hypothetical protein